MLSPPPSCAWAGMGRCAAVPAELGPACATVPLAVSRPVSSSSGRFFPPWVSLDGSGRVLSPEVSLSSIKVERASAAERGKRVHGRCYSAHVRACNASERATRASVQAVVRHSRLVRVKKVPASAARIPWHRPRITRQPARGRPFFAEPVNTRWCAGYVRGIDGREVCSVAAERTGATSGSRHNAMLRID